MAKKQKDPVAPPSKAYLVSFGDTMTTLLAFFIVLCSMAQDQTGANLHSGTGSFVRALDSFGMPGQYAGDRSDRAFQMEASSPLYIVNDGEQTEPQLGAAGPDDEDNRQRVIDREIEQLTRFMTEMERMSQVESKPEASGESVFDFFNRMNPEPPYLPKPVKQAMNQIIPLLRRDDYHVTVIVWATTPSTSAWTRAVGQASDIEKEIANSAGLNKAQQNHIESVGKPWLFKDEKRPVLSLLVQKLQSN